MITPAKTSTAGFKAVRSRLTPGRLARILAVLGVALVLVTAVAVAVGSEHVSVGAILRIIEAEITGRAIDISPEQRAIIAEIRLPRVLMGLVVGASLSVAGAAYQALLRNPLAEPYVLGVSTGAAVGAILATLFAGALPLSRPFAAFVGALVTIGAVQLLSQSRQGASSERLILAGVIINTFLSSMVIYLVTTVADQRQRSVISWLMGDLSAEARLLPLVAVFVVVGIAVIYANSRSLNLLMVGEEEALALGVEVKQVKAAVYIAASLITGAAVAVSGVIGFVGLVIPHMIRLAGGSDNRLVVPASALVGATFLVVTDAIARTAVAPRELHIGVITAMIGAPVFVYLLRKTS